LAADPRWPSTRRPARRARGGSSSGRGSSSGAPGRRLRRSSSAAGAPRAAGELAASAGRSASRSASRGRRSPPSRCLCDARRRPAGRPPSPLARPCRRERPEGRRGAGRLAVEPPGGGPGKPPARPAGSIARRRDRGAGVGGRAGGRTRGANRTKSGCRRGPLRPVRTADRLTSTRHALGLWTIRPGHGGSLPSATGSSARSTSATRPTRQLGPSRRSDWTRRPRRPRAPEQRREIRPQLRRAADEMKAIAGRLAQPRASEVDGTKRKPLSF